MIDSGLDVARLNFSHGNADEHRERARNLREAAVACGRDVGLLGDLQGPKIRVRRFETGSAHLRDGDAFFLDSALGLNDGDQNGVGVALDTLHEDVSPGDTLLLNDGLISLIVDRVEGTRIHTTVENGGILSDYKGINLKGGGLSATPGSFIRAERCRCPRSAKAVRRGRRAGSDRCEDRTNRGGG
jgi:pyruvate kinase